MVKTILYPTISMDILQLEMTPEESERYDNLAPVEKAWFIISNLSDEEKETTYPELIADLFSNGMEEMEPASGICKKCGCTQGEACYHPDYGPCSWEDENATLCSHCADPTVANDPRTKRPEIKKARFPNHNKKSDVP